MADDPDQTARARALVASGPTFLPRTVLLEAEWVLRAAYRLPPERVRGGLRRLLGLPDLTVEDLELVLRALDAAEAGVDLADALHHAASRQATLLATFDRAFVRRAAAARLAPPVREPSLD